MKKSNRSLLAAAYDILYEHFLSPCQHNVPLFVFYALASECEKKRLVIKSVRMFTHGDSEHIIYWIFAEGNGRYFVAISPTKTWNPNDVTVHVGDSESTRRFISEQFISRHLANRCDSTSPREILALFNGV